MALFNELYHYGIGRPLNLVFSDSQFYVKYQDQHSEPYIATRDVHQGGVVSVILYKLFYNQLFDTVAQDYLLETYHAQHLLLLIIL